MPVRLGLCASRANELLIGFPIQRFNVLTNHPDDALACAYSSDRSPRGGGRHVRALSPASWVGWFSGLADTILNSRPGSARVSRVGFGVSLKRTSLLRPIYLSRRSLGVGRTLQPFNLVTLLTNHIAEPTRGDLFTILRISFKF